MSVSRLTLASHDMTKVHGQTSIRVLEICITVCQFIQINQVVGMRESALGATKIANRYCISWVLLVYICSYDLGISCLPEVDSVNAV